MLMTEQWTVYETNTFNRQTAVFYYILFGKISFLTFPLSHELVEYI